MTINNSFSHYEDIISLGGSCVTGLTLRKLNKKTETYPFDWVRSTPEIIYDILINGYEKYISFNNNVCHNFNLSNFYDISSIKRPNFPKTHINYYGQHFTHYLDITSYELNKKYKKYFERFLNKLKTGKSILFIYQTENYIYIKNLEEKQNIFYNFLIKISEHIDIIYPNLSFKIINIQDNNRHENTKHIVNYSFTEKNLIKGGQYDIHVLKILKSIL